MKQLEVVAREELGETPELKKECLDKFRELLQENDLRLPPDYVLLTFLRARKYRLDDTVTTLENYFRARSNLPDYFENFSPSAIPYQTVIREHKLFMISKNRDSQGRAVGLIRFGAWNSSICSLTELVKSALVALECLLLEDETQIRGIVCVDDLAGLGMQHIMEMTPRFLRLIVALAQDTFPMRLKAFYIVNTPVVFERIYTFFVKPFLSKKLRERALLEGTAVKNRQKNKRKTMTRLQPGEIRDDEHECLEQLRRLLQEDGLRVLPGDEALLMFLRTKKYDVKKATKTIKNYFRVRKDMPEYFDNLTPSSIPYKTVCHDHKLIMHARERDPQGRAVGILKFGAWSTDICSMSNLMRCLLLSAECGLLEVDAQVHGVVAVIDLQGFSVNHLRQLTPWFLRKVMLIAQNSLPARIKAIYVVNTPAVAEYAVSLVQFFLPAKLKSRLHFFGGGFSELRGVIPSELIPKDFSGTQEDFDFHAQEDFFLGKASHFDSLRQCSY
ncbi:alpha-tocopherol transfer protein-like isoform X2 [Dermacentor silvarum]|uniref:alpha-tocopherol transfer protein-like isoform X2 n=1 Tax=Dermacentor silvarum TaxID=543639 RepID=UPI0021013F40|nr:alpha-tocopherol transfer protein-like isoform X2 [Dermacentor silvarum]